MAPLLYKILTFAFIALLLLAGKTRDTTLKDTFKNDFLIGAAVSYDQAAGKDSVGIALLDKHFSSITSENMLKWGPVHPEPDAYNFELADQFVQLGLENGMFIVGHALIWHQMTPRWVFEDTSGKPLGRDALLRKMKEHIKTVAGRYRDKIDGWDVVNEALNDDGSLRKSKWMKIIGEDYLYEAYATAQEASGDAELYYNDYNLWKPAKREGAIRLVKRLRAEGIAIAAIGMQGHYGLEYPSLTQIEESLEAFDDLGVKVMITELDIDVLPRKSSGGADLNEQEQNTQNANPYPDGLPEEIQLQLAQRYANLFALFCKHRDKIVRVTTWGVADHNSWLNNWPVRHRTNYPLLFDRQGKPKLAFEKVVGAACK